MEQRFVHSYLTFQCETKKTIHFELRANMKWEKLHLSYYTYYYIHYIQCCYFCDPTIFKSSTNSSILQNRIYCCDQSWIFCIITPVFSVTWSFWNQSNMLICMFALNFLFLNFLNFLLMLFSSACNKCRASGMGCIVWTSALMSSQHICIVNVSEIYILWEKKDIICITS